MIETRNDAATDPHQIIAKLQRTIAERTAERDDLLQQQTATTNVLKVISRSAFDLQPVLDTLVASAAQLCCADAGIIWLRKDDLFHAAAASGLSQDRMAFFKDNPRSIHDNSIAPRVLRLHRTVHIPDRSLDPDFAFPGLSMPSTMIGVPLFRNDSIEGVFTLSRLNVAPFTPRQIELVESFADQAAIAIENTRLFNEVQAKTRDLTEALNYQTGSAKILNVIATSPTDVQPVLNAIVQSACELCEAYDAVLVLKEGEELFVGAHHGRVPLNRTRWPNDRGTISGRAVADCMSVHVEDISILTLEFPIAAEMSVRDGGRTVLGIPLIRDGSSIGAIVLRRTEVRPFDTKQIALLQTFADQAVIAIENARLFKEVRQRNEDLTESLQQQTATSEVLRVISSSSGDLPPVFKVMLANALKICEATYGNMLLWNADGFEAAELHNSPPAFADLFKSGRLVPPPATALGRVIATKQVAHIPDIMAESGGVQQSPLRVVTVGSMRARTLLAVPMLRESELVGVIVIYRQEVRPFSERQIELVTNFADQAVIAIENARLLNELRMRTAELSQSLKDLSAAQDRLVQTEKLASLGQLTAGIAHEIKNPLNFVNNFSALSAELVDEMTGVFENPALDEANRRKELDEIRGLLKSNLEKVIQHGKRADSIVKNMLLHSREGSGEQRPADINALVEESLNLAYHGARAEKPSFNITLRRDFDASAGSAELYPQEITRALLNLISNGFYAATKRKNENGETEFEPTLVATTKDLGSFVEISIRDNGAGIQPEVKEKMFNPFFTTKPAGEGTGLGLSMTHDIIVKQHGGRIDVATEAGQFTEFKIVLPRSGPKQ